MSRLIASQMTTDLGLAVFSASVLYGGYSIMRSRTSACVDDQTTNRVVGGFIVGLGVLIAAWAIAPCT